MSLIKQLFFPYNSGSINGVFRQLKTSLNTTDICASNYINISASQPYSGIQYLYGALVNNNVCFHSSPKEGSEGFFIVDFRKNRFSMTGYTIHNTNPEDFHPYWEILISNDKNKWQQIDNRSLQAAPESATNSFEINQPVFPARYIKMRVEGNSFGFSDNRFAVYGFDMFGQLYLTPNDHTCQCNSILRTFPFPQTFIGILLL